MAWLNRVTPSSSSSSPSSNVEPKKWRRAGFVVAVGILGGAATTFAMGAIEDFQKPLVIETGAYVGNWEEVARTPNSFEDNTLRQDGVEYGPCFNSRTTYTAVDANTIELVNACEREATDGSEQVISESISGDARIQARSDNRKLKIAFGSPIARFFLRLFTGGGADYWIFDVGPKNADGQYSWALVSGPDRDFIFVLARNATLSDEEMAAVKVTATSEGMPFDDLISPRR